MRRAYLGLVTISAIVGFLYLEDRNPTAALIVIIAAIILVNLDSKRQTPL